jgi:hypothetical protein
MHKEAEMCNAEKNKELMRVFGLCTWPNKFINVIPHTRDLRFTAADRFLAFVAEEANFDFDWELYLMFEASRHDGQTVDPIAVVYASCIGRVYKPRAVNG